MPDRQPTAELSPRAAARELILKRLGVKRVAGWVGVSENAIHQGLSRSTDARPIPETWVVGIVAGAKAAGVDAPIGVLSPRMAEALA